MDEKFYQLKKLKSLRIKFIFSFILAIVMTSPAFSSIQNLKITLDVKNMSAKEFINVIQKQTGVDIVYISQDLSNVGNVTYKCKEKAIKEVLQETMISLGLQYRIENDKVTIFKPVVTPPAVVQQKTQQPKKITVSGVVVNEGQPVIGATVVVEGTTRGAITDDKGMFVVVVELGAKLVVSYINAVEQTIVVKDDKNLVVNLKTKMLNVSDVVVTGFGNIDRRKNTGGTQSLKAEDILVPGMSSIQEALEGRVPELQFMLNSGEVGATARLRLRGTSTLMGNREPLWVLDGVILRDPVPVAPEELNNPDYINIVGNAIAGINPIDIERIDILKDASATALYGTRAANGVIVVTTKKGAIGKPRISYNHTSKFTRRPRYSDKQINLMNSQERVEIGRSLVDSHYAFPSNMALVGYEGAIYRYQQGKTSFDEYLREVKIAETTNTDWFDILTRDSYSMGHTLTLSGGSETTRYYTSVGYDQDNGATKTTYADRYSMRVNLNTIILKGLTLDTRINGSIQKKNHLISSIDAMNYAYNTTRALPYKNPDGTLYYYDNKGYDVAAYGSSKYKYNITNEINNTENSYNGMNLAADIDLRYRFNDWLDVGIQSSYSTSSTLQREWWGEKTNYIALMRDSEFGEMAPEGENTKSKVPYGGILKQTNSRSENFSTRIQANFVKMFGENLQHQITASAGYDINSGKNSSSYSEERGYYKDRGMQFVKNIDIDLYPEYKIWLKENKNKRISSNITNMLAAYCVVAYSYKTHFTVNANTRFDASNKFGDRSNERLLPVWSTSAVWNLEQSVLKNVKIFNSVQLKGSYGKQGNMLDSQSPNLIIEQGVLDAYYGENVSFVNRLPNPNLRWEQTNSYNAQLDMSMFNSRLHVGFTYYYKKTVDAFTDVNVSTVNGVRKMVMNGGNIENDGFSISLTGTPIRTNDLSWTLSTYYSINHNTVTGDVIKNYGYENYLNGSAVIQGEAVGTFYSYKYQGLSGANGVPLFDDYQDRIHLLQGKPIEEVVKMAMTNSGKRDPYISGNLSSNFTYKQFSLNLNIAYSLGSKIRLFKLYGPVKGGIKSNNNLRKEFTNRWQHPGDELYTDVPVLMSPADPDYLNYLEHFSTAAPTKVQKFASTVWDMYDNADTRVVSGDYVKLQSMTLRYNFDVKFLEKTPLKGASISFSAMNLFTLASKELNGQDPSQSGFSTPNLSIRPNYTLNFSVSF